MINKLKTLLALSLFTVLGANAQNGNVGIGTTSPDTSAALDITSTTKGLLMPRMTTAERDLIGTPANGLMIFNTTINALETNTGTSLAPVWTSTRSIMAPYSLGVDSNGDGTIETTLPANRIAFNGSGTAKSNTDFQLMFDDNGTLNIGRLRSIDGTHFNFGGHDNLYLTPTTIGILGLSRRADINLSTISDTGGNGSLISGLRTRGTISARTGVLNGDRLFRITGGAYVSDNTFAFERVNIDFNTTSDFTPTGTGTRITFQATPNTSNTPNRLMAIAGTGTIFQNVPHWTSYNAPNASAVVEMNSTTQGFLPPRMTQTQLAAIVTPAEGLVVYCTNCTPKGLRVFDGTAWSDMNGNQAPANSVAPVVTNAPTTFALGTSVTFSATTGTWSGSPSSYTYRWFYDGAVISGATSATYTKSSVTDGTYYCAVSAVNGVGVSAETNSNTIVVSSVAPTNSVAPVITQTAVQFTATTGTWADAGSFTYQWKRDGAAIAGATSQTYAIQVADYNTIITCDVTGVNNIGNLTVASNAITHMIGNAAGSAYSLRKVTPDATLAIKVRRSSDNTTQDIGFDGSGNLDTAALTTFLAGSNGFVETWYDQSTNARHIMQATAANQPQIASAGNVFTRGTNNLPVIRFNGTSNVLSNSTPWMYNDNGLSSITALAVLIGNTSGNQVLLSETSSTSSSPVYGPISTGTSNALTIFFRGNSPFPLVWTPIQTGVFNNVYKSISIQDNGTTSSIISTNGSSVSPTYSYSRSTNIAIMLPRDRFSIGGLVRTTTGSWFAGDVSEMIIHSVVLPDALRDGIKASATTYFGL